MGKARGVKMTTKRVKPGTPVAHVNLHKARIVTREEDSGGVTVTTLACGCQFVGARCSIECDDAKALRRGLDVTDKKCGCKFHGADRVTICNTHAGGF